jgi:nucleoside-diphosphate kinase
MTISPIIAMVLEWEDSIKSIRNMCGATNPLEANSGTIRWDLSLTIRFNLVHASDSEENAKEEIARFFKKEEVFSYKKITDDIL